jgi:hypothetical protein
MVFCRFLLRSARHFHAEQFCAHAFSRGRFEILVCGDGNLFPAPPVFLHIHQKIGFDENLIIDSVECA